MTVHQCPKCLLRYEFKTELEDHCRTDHPEFRHDYPVGRRLQPAGPPPPSTDPAR
jgi:hypothetical protein